jgi:hypothetical protein
MNFLPANPQIVIILSVVIAGAGVLLFAVAPRTTNLYPPALLRGIGVVALALGVWPLWVVTEMWWPPVILAVVGLAILIMLHLHQQGGRIHNEEVSPKAPHKKPGDNVPTVPNRFTFLTRQSPDGDPPADDTQQ